MRRNRVIALCRNEIKRQRRYFQDEQTRRLQRRHRSHSLDIAATRITGCNAPAAFIAFLMQISQLAMIVVAAVRTFHSRKFPRHRAQATAQKADLFQSAELSEAWP